MRNTITRRSFVIGGAATAGAMFALAGCAGQAASSSAASSEASASAEAAASSAAESASASAAAASASAASTEAVPIRLGGLKGPTSMGMVKMLEDAAAGNAKNEIEFTIAPTGDELVPKIIQGELDILAVPSNLGAVLYNNQDAPGMVQMLAANMLGAIYVLEVGETVNSIEDLAGQTIYTVGKGSTPEYLLGYLLAEHGLTIDKDVTVEFRNDPTEIVGYLASGQANLAMLPQPFVTIAMGQVDGLRIALDTNAEWDALDNGSKLITAGLIARTDFVEAHPQQVADFLDDLSVSTDWTNANVEEAAALITKYTEIPTPVAQASLPQCNVVCITGEEMKKSTEAYFQVLFDQNPASIGGAMPGDDFYYEP